MVLEYGGTCGPEARLLRKSRAAAHSNLFRRKGVTVRTIQTWILITGFVGVALVPRVTQPATVVIENHETAGMSGFLRNWDKPDPGAKTFDARHRSVLLRFPGAAEELWTKATDGLAVTKAEVILSYAEYELNPRGYTCRTGLGQQKWKDNPPQWHVIAWPLRRPWKADAEIGPTYNAYIHGAGYWSRFGATDTQRDRHAVRLGPAELSSKHPQARIDVTALLTDEAYGKTLGTRMRQIEECGLALQKWETYDIRYDDWWSAYEWANPTGGHGLSFEHAKLVVTFGPGGGAPGNLPRARDVAAMAESLKARGGDGKPTAALATPDQLKAMAEEHRFRQPQWMPDWQWRRVQELASHEGGRIQVLSAALESGDPEQYQKIVEQILAIPPRYWQGWSIQADLLLWYLYHDMLPEPVHDHIRAYWEAWLMPDMPTDEFLHPQSRENPEYYQRTGDWRGRKSFFRDGYNYTISTMNFNHTAAMGALLGGEIIGAERAIADGRHGLEHLPLRLWAWYDGTTQESIDHYYFSITLSGQKMFADFGPTHLDRLMGQSILAKSVEEACSTYHPSLKRFISCGGRTGISYLLVIQEGLQHIVHTLSHRGALHDLKNSETFGMPQYGNDVPPARVAIQTRMGPWAPEWAANMVDEKPLPYQMTSAYKKWGNFAKTPLWRRTYLGRHYGMASLDVSSWNESVPAMAQWRRSDRVADNVQDVGTLLIRYGLNTTNLLASGGGTVGTQGGHTATVQHENKMIVLTSPFNRLEYPRSKLPDEIKSLQTTIGILNFEPKPSWEILLDGRRVANLPARSRLNQRITIKDGVSYLGIIPVPATDLGRTAELVLSRGVEQEMQGGGKATPALLIESYNYKSDTPLRKNKPDWKKIDQAYGGFVIEMGDVTEYGSFEAFRKHIAEAKLSVGWDAQQALLAVDYRSGDDHIECGYRPEYEGDWDHNVPTDQCFPYRRVNGEWPYLPDGIERDSTLSQQGTTGRLDKNCAVLLSEPGRMTYLQTEPRSWTCAGFNPLPSPCLWSLDMLGGFGVRADGRVGLMRVIVQPQKNKLQVDYAVKDDQRTPDMASALLVFDCPAAPTVELNGELLEERPTAVKIDGEQAYVIPLTGKPAATILKGLEERYRRAQKSLAESTNHRQDSFVQDWYVVGPFANKDSNYLWAGVSSDYPPQQKLAAPDLTASYIGTKPVDGKEVEFPVRWRRIVAHGQPALGPDAVPLEELFDPNTASCAFAYTKIHSDRQRAVTIYTGSDNCLAVWLNGEQVLTRDVYRAAAPDQDKATVTLQKGNNHVLVRSVVGHEGWRFYFRLGDQYGFPIRDGLHYGFSPQRSDAPTSVE